MNIKETTSDFIKQSKRVLKVARKPDRELENQIVKNTLIFPKLLQLVLQLLE